LKFRAASLARLRYCFGCAVAAASGAPARGAVSRSTAESGWMLAFTFSLDDLVIASFTTGPGATTLPIRIYSEVRLGVKPEINAVSTIFISFVASIALAASLLSKFYGAGRASRQRRSW
jgi:putrescine transport system permease protein